MTAMSVEPAQSVWSGSVRNLLRCLRWLVAIGATVLLTSFGVLPAHAEPLGSTEIGPFPDEPEITAWYTEMPPSDFFVPGQDGVWFLSPSGLTCGIWTWGSFGCTGPVPGLPPGESHIAWFNGNRSVHHGWTAAIQFPRGVAHRTLPPRSYVLYATPGSGETMCAVTPQGNTYCGHGEFKFITTPEGTWFRAWNDRNSYICNSYGTCPPG